MISIINLANKFNLFQEPWHPRIVGELNDSYVKLAKLKGEFVWHHHDNEDELFFVVHGSFRMDYRDESGAERSVDILFHVLRFEGGDLHVRDVFGKKLECVAGALRSQK